MSSWLEDTKFKNIKITYEYNKHIGGEAILCTVGDHDPKLIGVCTDDTSMVEASIHPAAISWLEHFNISEEDILDYIYLDLEAEYPYRAIEREIYTDIMDQDEIEYLTDQGIEFAFFS